MQKIKKRLLNGETLTQQEIKRLRYSTKIVDAYRERLDTPTNELYRFVWIIDVDGQYYALTHDWDTVANNPILDRWEYEQPHPVNKVTKTVTKEIIEWVPRKEDDTNG